MITASFIGGVQIAGSAGTVINDGSIYGDNGLYIFAGASVTNAAAGSITGGLRGIFITGGATTVVKLTA